MTIYNCHIHSFTTKHIPDRFFGLATELLIHNPELVKPLIGILNWAGKNTPISALAKYAAYLGISDKKNQTEVFDYVKGFYPNGTRFVVLPMDFTEMKRGNPKEDYLKQLQQLAELKRDPNYNDIIYPFIAVDPRRPDLLNLVKEYIEVHKFKGIKLYPSLGYFPDDPRLMPIYEYANQNKLPITAHCIPENAVYYSGQITNQDKQKALNINPQFKFKGNSKFTRYYNHPLNYVPILEKFKDLKINLAHFGGNEEWDKYLNESWDNAATPNPYDESWYSIIKNMLEKYQNLYSDISFTVSDVKLFPLLKITLQNDEVKNQILFGSDFYMLEKNVTERRFSIDVRGYLDKSDYELISNINPEKFLF